MGTVNDNICAAIAEACGKRFYRFCGEYDHDHDMYRVPDSEMPKIAAGHSFFRCTRCDGYRWGESRIWDEASEARHENAEYCSSLDDINEARRQLIPAVDRGARARFMNALREIVGRRLPANKAGVPLVSDYDLLDAFASEHAQALVKALKLPLP